MSNTPEIIPFGKRPVRLVTINGVAKFAAKDICNILSGLIPNFYYLFISLFI